MAGMSPRALRSGPVSITIPRLHSSAMNPRGKPRIPRKEPSRLACRQCCPSGLAVRRILIVLTIVTLTLAGGSVGWVCWRARTCLPQLDGTIAVPGLTAPVSVLRDARGVPHIRAQSVDDALLAQGYVTAQDRLWQMDLSRRLAGGELSAILGARTLQMDIENRTLGLHLVAEQALEEMDGESRRVFSAYTQGVNAFIESHRSRLPIEFLILRYEPRAWTETDSIRVGLNMAKTLSTSWPDDLMRERVCGKVTLELCRDLFPDRTPLDRPVAGSLNHPTAKTASIPASLSPMLGELDTNLHDLIAPFQILPQGMGSNNWVLSGAHTQSEKPLLANDPHLGHGVPSVWYMIHLKAPGVNVIGVSFPGLPGVILGHNERIAWGATNTAPDVQDLYVEKFDSQNPNRYLHNGRWVDADVRDEVIKVRNKPGHLLTVKVTRHGPIILSEGGRELALQWTLLQPRAFYLPFWKMGLSENWQQFVAALRGFTCPVQNFVYADVDGNIGYCAPGGIPIRRKGDGTIPVDGSTDDHDWAGYVPFEDLPQSYNPTSGLIATANGRVVPDDYPYFITRMWGEPYRTARIYQLLEAGNHFTVPQMLEIQSDIFAMHDKWLAEQIVAASEEQPPGDPDAQYALEVLRGWDGKAYWDSPAPLITKVAERALLERLLKPKLGEDFASYACPMTPVFVENVLNNQWARWLPPGELSFAATVIKSLEDGVRKIPEITGSRNRAAWRWGETISLTFRHPLGSLPLAGRLLNVGPFPQSGTSTTVKQTTAHIGASMRMVVDLGNLDKSVQNITLGQSGQVLSPYYRDQFQAWYEGQSFSMPFTDAAVETGTTHRLVLLPGS